MEKTGPFVKALTFGMKTKSIFAVQFEPRISIINYSALSAS